MAKRRKPGPATVAAKEPRCSCCGGAMARPAVCCGVCFTKLPFATQRRLHDHNSPGWAEAWERFKALVAQGKKPEEIWL